MNKQLTTYIEQVKKSFDSIPASRKETLSKVADYIRSKMDSSEPVRLNFICTHNSRRSHLAQLWTGLAAHHFGLNIETYSGGTEATAFNPSAVDALARAGFIIHDPGGNNPKYELSFADDTPPFICFSKTFDDPVNPASGFAAIMTCSDADENCPFVPGSEFRIPVTYRDPKESDGTVNEAITYDERCFQIATEMFYMLSLVG